MRVKKNQEKKKRPCGEGLAVADLTLACMVEVDRKVL